MGLEKAIKYKKEHRKEYRGPQAIDKTCRCHGGCDYCLENRMHKFKKAALTKDYKNEDLVQIEKDQCDYLDANIQGVTLNGIPLDGNYLSHLVNTTEF